MTGTRSAGCAHYAFVSLPMVSNRTGAVNFAENATSTCKHGHASVEMHGGLSGPSFRPNNSGNLTISFEWHVGASQGGAGFYTNFVQLVGNLFDNTSGVWVLNPSAVLLLARASCGGGGCNFYGGFGPYRGISTTRWLNFSAPVAANHTYRFYTYVVANASVSNCAVTRGGHLSCVDARAVLDLRGPNFGALILAMRAS